MLWKRTTVSNLNISAHKSLSLANKIVNKGQPSTQRTVKLICAPLLMKCGAHKSQGIHKSRRRSLFPAECPPAIVLMHMILSCTIMLTDIMYSDRTTSAEHVLSPDFLSSNHKIANYEVTVLERLIHAPESCTIDHISNYSSIHPTMAKKVWHPI